MYDKINESNIEFTMNEVGKNSAENGARNTNLKETPLNQYANRQDYLLDVKRVVMDIGKIRERINSLESFQEQFLLKLSNTQHSIENFIEQMKPETTHSNLLLSLQRIDRWVETIKSEDTSFVKAIKEEIRKSLSLYGLKLVDYSDDTVDLYKVDFLPIKDSYELVYRAITNFKGDLVMEGRVYICNTNKSTDLTQLSDNNNL